jgi:hypothetical protein
MIDLQVGVSPSGKAAGFDPAIRRFESFHPSQVIVVGAIPRPEVTQEDELVEEG